MALEPQKKPDIFIIRGDDTSINFTVVGVDLTGATVYFTAKPTLSSDADDSEAVIEVVVTDHTDPTNGVTVIPLSHSDTDIDPGIYYYDIQVLTADNSVISIPARKLRVWGDVTRRID